MESHINVVKENEKDGCRTPSSIFSPRPVFNPGDFSGLRPPEVADVLADITESQYLDTSLLDNDPATTDLLMQLFLSDVTPEEELLKLGSVSASTTPPTTLDVGHDASEVSTASTPTSSLATVPQLPSPDPLVQLDSGTSSVAPSPSPVSGVGSRGNMVTGDNVISAFIFSASSLECTDSNGFNDPLDTPFLNESMDLTDFLQNPCVLNSVSTSPTPSDCNNTPSLPSSVLPKFCPSTPSICHNTDVHVNTLTNTCTEGELDLFELAQTASITSSTFDAPQVENLDIDFSTFCSDTLSLVPSSPDELTTEQLSVMLSQSRTSTPSPSTTTIIDNLTSVSITNTDDVVSTESSPSPPPSVSAVSSPAASPKAQKRTASDLESDTDTCLPKSKKTKLSRRQKNNIASQVSRAKRRAKNVAMSDRVGELESANALLRIKEKELTAEIEKLKKLLVNRLSQ